MITLNELDQALATVGTVTDAARVVHDVRELRRTLETVAVLLTQEVEADTAARREARRQLRIETTVLLSEIEMAVGKPTEANRDCVEYRLKAWDGLLGQVRQSLQTKPRSGASSLPTEGLPASWERKRMAAERVAATVAMIRRAIQDRACLSGSHLGFRVRFAPHILGRDENGRHIVIAFEYGGPTSGQQHWVYLVANHLRGLQHTEDPWRTGPLESRPKFNLTEIEVAIDDCWGKKAYGEMTTRPPGA